VSQDVEVQVLSRAPMRHYSLSSAEITRSYLLFGWRFGFYLLFLGIGTTSNITPKYSTLLSGLQAKVGNSYKCSIKYLTHVKITGILTDF